MTYTAFFDGACEPRNPGGTAGYGAVIFNEAQRVWQHSGMIPASPLNSNNVAEYLAFNAALDWFIENNLTNAQILIKGDSMLVIQQCFGRWRVKKGLYAKYAIEAKEKVKKFSTLQGKWISRVHNTLADELSRGAINGKLEPGVSTENWAGCLKT